MSSSSAIYLVFAAVALLIGSLALLAHDMFFRYRSLLRERVDELSGKSKNDGNASLFKDLKQFNADASLAKVHWRTRLRNILEQADLRIGLPSLLGVSLGVGLALGIAAVFTLKRWWVMPLGPVAGISAAMVYIRLKYKVRIRRLGLQLPEAFDAIGRAVRAGQTVPAAFQLVGDDFDPPISEEFRRCYEQQNLGMPYDIALKNLASRTGIMELRILVVALLVQSRSGGNLVELLDNLSMMVRNRVRLQQKVKALTGEGRMQAAVLIVLPVLAFAGMLVLSPHYVSSLLERPWLLAGAGIAQLVGAFCIRRIVSFEF
jgi:tight adherence protein B